MKMPLRPDLSRFAGPAAAALIAALLACPAASSQTPPESKGGAPSGSRARERAKKFSSSQTPPNPAVPAPAASSGSPGSSSKDAAPAKADAKAPADKAGEPGKPILGSIVEFLQNNATYVVVVMLAGGTVVTFFALRGSAPKKKKKVEEPDIPVRPKAPAEEDGPRRVLVTPGAPKPATPPKDDKDYALVVNEEDLKMPPLPEESAPRKAVDTAELVGLIEKEKYADAYREYIRKIEADGRSELSPDVERRLGGHFLDAGDLEKAGRILEHHVATHAAGTIDPKTYFDLAYIHFRTNTLAKSKRYFRLFADHNKDPQQVERARKVLAKLERVQNLN